MKNTDKGFVAFVKATKKSLGTHGIAAPYTAVRAALLEAQGLHSHAFSSKGPVSGNAQALQLTSSRELHYKNKIAELQKLVDKAPVFFHPGYDFDGEKLQWLKEAGHLNNTAKKKHVEKKYRYVYHSATGESAGSNVCLDSQLRFPLLGGTDGLNGNGLAAFSEFIGNALCRIALKDESSEDTAWHEIVGRTLDANESFLREVVKFAIELGVEWETLSPSEEKQIAAQYLEFIECSDIIGSRLEWVLPDEDSDSVPVKVDLESGKVFFSEKCLPAELSASYLRFRVEYEENLFDVQTVWHDDVLTSAKLTEKALVELNTFILNMS